MRALPAARRFFKICAFIGCVSSVLFSCAAKRSEPVKRGFALGTICAIRLYERGTAEIYDELFDLLRGVERIFSANSADSQLARINAQAGKSAVTVDKALFLTLERAIEIARTSDGAFNPAIGPIVKLWNIGTDKAAVPEKELIDEVLPLTDYRLIELNKDDCSVFLPKEGMSLDLGGIAKGYAAQLLLDALRERGIERAIIDLGGSVSLLGQKARRVPWTVGIREPRAEEDARGASVIGLRLADTSVVTSGIYERFFVSGGVHYHHIFDCRTGRPADSDLLSVTVINPDPTLADALSTAAFVAGVERGMEIIASYPRTEAVFIASDNTVYATDGARNFAEILDADYRFAR